MLTMLIKVVDFTHEMNRVYFMLIIAQSTLCAQTEQSDSIVCLHKQTAN